MRNGALEGSKPSVLFSWNLLLLLLPFLGFDRNPIKHKNRERKDAIRSDVGLQSIEAQQSIEAIDI